MCNLNVYLDGNFTRGQLCVFKFQEEEQSTKWWSFMRRQR